MEERAKKIAELLKLLANEQRLLILCALLEGKLTVSDIHLHTPDITASALSQHLNKLRTAGTVSYTHLFRHLTAPYLFRTLLSQGPLYP